MNKGSYQKDNKMPMIIYLKGPKLIAIKKKLI